MMTLIIEEEFSVRKIHRAFALLWLCVFALSLAVPAAAAPFDPSRTGSLKIRILETRTREGVPGGRVEIYQIAEVGTNSQGYAYVLTEAFARSGFDTATIGDLTASQNLREARKLEAYADSHRIDSMASAVPDRDGKVLFEDLPLGLYLVVQSEAASRHECIDSFLITVPQKDGENYVYDVNAAPKTGTADTIPTTAPTRPHHGGLPQTGQLWWPVYLLAAVGAALFLFGLYRRKRAAHE